MIINRKKAAKSGNCCKFVKALENGLSKYYNMHLIKRNRILRTNSAIRNMVAETTLTPNDLMAPLFVIEGENKIEEIPSMPNYYRHSIDKTIEEAKELWELRINTILLFVKCGDALKDNTGKESWNPEGLMQRSVRAIKEALPQMIVMTDVALDPYSSYGHDGIIEEKTGKILN